MNSFIRTRTKDINPASICGIVISPVAAWAALAPYVAGDWSWSLHSGRFVLGILPAALAAVGALLMITGQKTLVRVGGTVALAGGVWFIAGPILYGLPAGLDLGTDANGQSVRLLQWFGFYFGAGALISVVSAYALGLLRPLEFGDDEWAGIEEAPSTVTPAAAEEQPRSRRTRERSARRERPHVRSKSPARHK
jgi:hypothetical protein